MDNTAEAAAYFVSPAFTRMSVHGPGSHQLMAAIIISDSSYPELVCLLIMPVSLYVIQL